MAAYIYIKYMYCIEVYIYKYFSYAKLTMLILIMSRDGKSLSIKILLKKKYICHSLVLFYSIINMKYTCFHLH